MKALKKITLLSIAASLFLGLGGCFNRGGEQNKENNNHQEKSVYSISDLYPSLSNINVSNINKYKYIWKNLSTGPGNFRRITVTNNADGLQNFCDFINQDFRKSDGTIPPGTATFQLYIDFNGIDDMLFEIYGGNYISVNSQFYVAENSFVPPTNGYLSTLGFNIFPTVSYVAISTSDQSEYEIDYIEDVEFIPWPREETYDKTLEASFIMGSPLEDVSIYTANRFSMSNDMYKIVFSRDFSSLFN